jgi:hypothetical protein
MIVTTESVASENLTNARREESPFLVFRLSWVAYISEVWLAAIRLLVIGLITLAMVYIFAGVSKTPPMDWLFLVGIFVTLLWTAYSIALKWSVRLYTDEIGVWVYSGIFPWETGVSGAKWQDISESTYTRGFMSWIMRSFSVRVGHRFTNGAELYVENIHRGNLAVEHINGVLASIAGRVSRVG